MFSGTVRSNLDPYGRHNDAELWDALGHVALKEVVTALAEGLSSRVAENGGWVVGAFGAGGSRGCHRWKGSCVIAAAQNAAAC